MSKQRKVLPAVTGITLDDFMPKWSTVPEVKDWYEDHFYLVVGEMGDYDFLLETSFIILKGPPGGGNWLVEDAVVNNTLFFMLPKVTRGKMLDNDFIAGDDGVGQYHKGSDLKVIRARDRVIWKLAGRELIARPPYWEIHGSHRGISMELVMHSVCPIFWYMGEFKDLSQNRAAGGDEFVQAEGTITVGGRKYEVSHAGGCAEHIALGGWNQASLVAQGRYLQFWGWLDEIQLFAFYQPGMGVATGHVIVDGKATSFQGKDQVSVDEREFWGDPKSGFIIGCKWHINMRSPEGTFDAILTNGGRGLHVNTLSDGHIARFWNLATANGSFTFSNGRTIPIKNMLVGIDRSIAFSVFK